MCFSVARENQNGTTREMSSDQKCILVTGGAGFVGTHTCVELLEAGYKVVVVDNFSNSSSEAIKRVEEITKKTIETESVDIANEEKVLESVFETHKIDAVMHIAGLKAVGESVQKPLLYYSNNINSTLNLLRCMEKFNVNNLIFSSSATVYGLPERIPLTEDCRVGVGITNPYGRTKFFIEEIIADQALAKKDLRAVLLRYFNPVGAHTSGRIGEDPHGPPNNLMPYISQVAVGRRECLNVFGNDYDTVDGTGVRDYIHVVDLAKGHLAALEKKIFSDAAPDGGGDGAGGGVSIYNLGRCKGVSVLELHHAMEKACGHEIKYKIVERRKGDVGTNFADCKKAEKDLEWKAELGVEKMCEDQWRWQSKNPKGYETTEQVVG